MYLSHKYLNFLSLKNYNNKRHTMKHKALPKKTR